MNRKHMIIAAILIQFIVPVTMMTKNEAVLTRGHAFNFKTRPVDPYDVMRGRYVALGIEQNFVEYTGKDIQRGMYVYAIVENDEENFAYISDVKFKKPRFSSYLRVKVRSAYGKKCIFEMPFSRYYMNEKDAPKAEKLYRRSSLRRGEGLDSYIKVKVYKGDGVIEDLIVNGKPILELLQSTET